MLKGIFLREDALIFVAVKCKISKTQMREYARCCMGNIFTFPEMLLSAGRLVINLICCAEPAANSLYKASQEFSRQARYMRLRFQDRFGHRRLSVICKWKTAGGIGVGGGTEEQDCAIAEYVVSVFEKLIK